MYDYFDWYKMFDIEWVRFSKMTLVEPATKFRRTVTTHLKHMNLTSYQPLSSYERKVMEYDLPSFYRAHLVDQDLRQSTSSVAD